MDEQVLALIGLGANIGQPRLALEQAVAALSGLPGVALAGVSRLYRTAPVGPVPQADFLNAAIGLRLPAQATPADGATELLVALKRLERALGRVDRERWGPREIDLDLLLYGQARLRVERPVLARSEDPARAGVQWLEVPHPAAAERLFVLAPLADLVPDLVPPGWSVSVAGARARETAAAGPAAVQPTGEWDASLGRWHDRYPPEPRDRSSSGPDTAATVGAMDRVFDPRHHGTLGLGCWAIGGPFYASDGRALGWGDVDDDGSISAIHRALELGVRIFDTADVYGAGHSERVLGRALGERRADVLVISKFGNVFDEETKRVTGQRFDAEHIRAACEASRSRLGTDRLDVLLVHSLDIGEQHVDPVIDALEGLVADGHIRSYGWSTDEPEQIRRIARSPNCSSVEIGLNVLADAPETVRLLDELELVAFVRSPLAMGLLAGRITRGTRLAEDDIRGVGAEWLEWFEDGRATPAFMDQVDAVRAILEEHGRSMAAGALGWLWARSPWLIPIPGFRTVAQVEQLAAAREHGPLRHEQMARIAVALGR